MRCVDEYHQFYEQKRMWENTYWLGVPMWKLPFDAMVIQEIIYEVKPDCIIETGTGHGGSAAFYASICELIGHGKVITIDIENKVRELSHLPSKIRKRIITHHGSSINPLKFNRIKSKCNDMKNLVILDSWHSYDHVCKELEMYEELVPVGSYLIVEDTHVSGHPVHWEHGKGPYEAVEWFLSTRDYFEPQYWCEKYIMTFNPKGYLKRIN